MLYSLLMDIMNADRQNIAFIGNITCRSFTTEVSDIFKDSVTIQ